MKTCLSPDGEPQFKCPEGLAIGGRQVVFLLSGIVCGKKSSENSEASSDEGKRGIEKRRRRKMVSMYKEWRQFFALA
jgi:hypothetical protein